MSEPPKLEPSASPVPTDAPAPAFKPNRASQTAKDCALADAAAFKTFSVLKGSTHTPNSLGRSWQEVDSMVCDCSYEHGSDDPHRACGETSDCINRLTQVECLESECRCGAYCRNQRFTKRQYANIEVIQTERKGYGLRAGEPIAADTFIYEYVGEVVEKKAFLDRMQKYAEEGIRHFYFMELQKDEYIDATRKGGIGRFANHSCNPNCYVAKWVVGKRMRMGIFAKRDVEKGEELTFNYNVDRYGHDAQPCYCDEPNCVGSIGGKTQTDVGGLDDLYLDALGITAEVESKGLKGSKRRKAMKLGEDYMPTITPITELEVPKVVAAVRQATSNRPVLCILLQRMKMTADPTVLRRIMHLHGFGMMSTVLKEFADDREVLQHVLEVMLVWPLQNRNKVEDSGIRQPVTECIEGETADEQLKATGAELLARWEALPTAYRIRRLEKVQIPDAEDDEVSPGAGGGPSTSAAAAVAAAATSAAAAYITATYGGRQAPEVKPVEQLFKVGGGREFVRPEAAPVDPRRSSVYALQVLQGLQQQQQQQYQQQSQTQTPPHPQAPAAPKKEIGDILAEALLARQEAERKAAEKAVQEAARLAEEEAAERERLRLNKGKAREKKRKRQQQPGAGGKLEPKGNEAHKEKRLLGLVGEVVVKSMSKYKDQMDHGKFKEYAKQCAQLIVAKEKKSASFITVSQVPPLSDEKKAKIKKFTKEFTHRVLKKLKKAAAAAAAAQAGGGGAKDGGGDEESMSREIAAEMAADDPDDDEDDGDYGDGGDDLEGEAEGSGTAGEPEGTPAKVSRVDGVLAS